MRAFNNGICQAKSVRVRAERHSARRSFALIEKISELEDKSTSNKLNTEIGALLKEITAEFLLPGKG